MRRPVERADAADYGVAQVRQEVGADYGASLVRPATDSGVRSGDRVYQRFKVVEFANGSPQATQWVS